MTTGLSASLANTGQLTDRAGLSTKKKPRRLFKWIASFIVVAVAALVIGRWVAPSWFLTASAATQADRFTIIPRDFAVVLKEKGELKAAKSTDIICEVEGRTRIISLIPEGTAVKEGDLLVTLASDQIEEKTRQEELKESNAITAYESAKTELEIQRDRNESDNRKAQLQIELRKLELERYQLGDWERQLKDHQIAIDQAKIALERRREDFEASQQLHEKNFITQTEYEEDEFNYQRAQWDLDKAEKALDVLEKYSHVADLRQKESDLEEAIKEAERVRKNAIAEEAKKQRGAEGAEKELALIREQLAKLRNQKEKCRITAPTQGFVVYYGGGGGGGRWMSGDNQIREGAEVYERQILMQLPDTSEMAAVVRIHEAKTDKLKIGQSVMIDVEGVPGKRFPGRVAKIAVVADTQNRWLNPDLKEYETEIAMEKADVLLKPGVTAHAEIFVDSVEDRLAVPVHSVYSKGGKRYVFTVDGEKQTPVEVALGATGTEWVELLKGVTENQVIVTAASEDARRLLPDAPTGERTRNGPPGMNAGNRPGAPGGGKPQGGENSERRAGPAGSAKPADQERAAKPVSAPASTSTKGN